MKPLHLLSTALIFGSFAFSACNKTQYNVSPETKSAQLVQGDNSASLSRRTQLTTGSESQSNASRLVVSSGYVNTSYISIWGNERMEYEAHDLKRINLFAPLHQAGIPIGAPAHYNGMILKMTTTESNGGPGMSFKGIVRIDDDLFLPVEININEPLQLQSGSRLQSVEESTMLINLMNIMPERIGENITSNMWEGARTPGAPGITISSEQNPELYRIIVANLSSMVKMDFVGSIDAGGLGQPL